MSTHFQAPTTRYRHSFGKMLCSVVLLSGLLLIKSVGRRGETGRSCSWRVQNIIHLWDMFPIRWLTTLSPTRSTLLIGFASLHSNPFTSFSNTTFLCHCICLAGISVLYNNITQCQSIYWIPLLKVKLESTSSNALYKAPTVSLWILNALDAFKLLQSLAMPKLSLSVDLVMWCYVNPREEKRNWQRVVVSGKRKRIKIKPYWKTISIFVVGNDRGVEWTCV